MKNPQKKDKAKKVCEKQQKETKKKNLWQIMQSQYNIGRKNLSYSK